MGLVSQWYFAPGQAITDSQERLVLVGGYGGWPANNPNYTGVYCWPDSWTTYDGGNWTLLNSNNSFGPRAWSSLNVLHSWSPQRYLVGSNASSPRMFLFGGGIAGNSTETNMRFDLINAYPDAWSSRDGANWTQSNFQSGDDYVWGYKYQPLYSSQEWTQTVVNTVSYFLGMWGHTVVNFNATNGREVSDISGCNLNRCRRYIL
jgi:hypothetical protein